MDHGVGRTSDFLADMSRWDFDRAVRSGEIVKIRQGWYRLGQCDERAVTAVRRGGVLTGLSVLADRGVWVPDPKVVHVRTRTEWKIHHNFRPDDVRGPVDTLRNAFLAALTNLDPENQVIMIDSMLDRGLISESVLADVISRLPQVYARSAARYVVGAQSGGETATRIRLVALGIDVQVQVFIRGVGRVDLLIGRLVVECDSRAWHDNPNSYAEDRRRDAVLTSLGYDFLRLTYADIFHNWAETEARILDLVRRRVHRRRLHSRNSTTGGTQKQ